MSKRNSVHQNVYKEEQQHDENPPLNKMEIQLKRLLCHFTWEDEYDIEYEREKSSDLLSSADFRHDNFIEVHRHNLLGYFKYKDGDYENSKKYFKDAIEKSSTEGEKVVALSCLAWMYFKEAEKSHDDQAKTKMKEKSNKMIQEVDVILNGSEMENLPEMLFEKAYVVKHSTRGTLIEKFKKAISLIDQAIERSQETLIYRLTKAKTLQKLLIYKNKRLNKEDKDVQSLGQLWKDLIAMTDHCDSLTEFHAEILAWYALFLNKANYDYGKTGLPYAEKAFRLGESNPYVLRKVAQFYKTSAVRNISKLDKAVKILRGLLKQNFECYQTRNQLGEVLIQKYKYYEGSMYSKEKIFREAEENLKKSWEANRNYFIPALDLVTLYCEKHKCNATKDVSVLVKAEEVLHQMLDSIQDMDSNIQASLCFHYGQFINKYSVPLALHRQQIFGQNIGYCSSLPTVHQIKKQITEAIQLTETFEETHDYRALCKADKTFLSIYKTLDVNDDDTQITFHTEYVSFIQKYHKDLAIMYFIMGVRYNPQGRTFISTHYDLLEELIKEELKSSDIERRFNGLAVLYWAYTLKSENRQGDEYSSKAFEVYQEALKLNEEKEIYEVFENLNNLKLD